MRKTRKLEMINDKLEMVLNDKLEMRNVILENGKI